MKFVPMANARNRINLMTCASICTGHQDQLTNFQGKWFGRETLFAFMHMLGVMSSVTRICANKLLWRLIKLSLATG